MLIKQGLRNHLVSTLPTREFTFIVDPQCISLLQQEPYKSILQLIIDLTLVAPPVKVQLVLPAFMADSTTRFVAKSIDAVLEFLDEPKDTLHFNPSSAIQEDIRHKLLEGSEEAERARALLALAKNMKADGVVTRLKSLLDARYPIYQHEQISIIPLNEFADLVEVSAHGHSIFWSAYHSHALTFDVFYIMTHPKNVRYARWWNSVQARISNQELNEHLRSALLNRYPFLLYARDMIRFYQLQKDYYSRRGSDRFGIPLAYHVNFFYLLLWGMLDQLTLIAKYARNLTLDDKACGISSKQFWKELGQIEPALERFVKQNRVGDWISVMAVMRHAAAHKIIPMPTRFLVKTEQSEKSDDEILQIIRREDSDSNELLSAPWNSEQRKWIEQNLIFKWRIDKMRTVADHVVTVKVEDFTYTLTPVISVDHYLAMLTGVMDAFLIKLFSDYALQASHGTWR